MPLITSEYVFSDDYPTIEPSLRLDFANARALDSRITFTRASTATYVGANGLIKTAGEDEPRFDHDPTTGESLGLLIEESRTNLYPISETFASWNVDNNATKTTDGTTIAGLTAIKLTSNVDTNALFLEGNNATFTANTTYTSSVYHKVGNVDGFWFEARFFSGGGTPKIYFNSSTETWSATSGGTAPATWSVKSQKVESNAWRHSITFYIDTDTAGTLRMGALAPANSTNVSTGDYGYLAAPQIEVGSFPTSYIPTSGSTVTRQMETMSLSGSNFSSWNNQSEGTYIMTIKNNSTDITGLPSPARTQSIFLFFAPDADGNYTKNLTSNVQMAQLPVNTTDYRKWAFYHHGANGYGMCINGNTPTESNQPIGTSDTSITFNDSQGQTSFYLKSLFYYPKRLTNAQLQTLTQ